MAGCKNLRRDGGDVKALCDEILALHRSMPDKTGDRTPLRVLITGAGGQVAYSLFYPLATGLVFGMDQPVILVLLDMEALMTVLRGVAMELADCSLPLLKDIVVTSDLKTAFEDIDVAIMLSSLAQKNEKDEGDLLHSMVKIVREHGVALDTYAKKTVRVLVISQPCHTNAYILSHYASSIPPQNFTSFMRLDQNRSIAQVSLKAGVSNRCVRKIIVWGENCQLAHADATHGELSVLGAWSPISKVLMDDHWIRYNLIYTVSERGDKVMQTRKLSCSLSCAMAICDHLRDWWFGTKPDHWVCMGVQSDGSYGVEKGLFFGFPVTIKPDGTYEIVQGLACNDDTEDRIEEISHKLIEQRKEAMKLDALLPPFRLPSPTKADTNTNVQ